MSLLEVKDVAKRYGPVVALRSADLLVEPGEIHALMGANGAGKSTLVKILTGVISRDAGEITVSGEPVTIGSPQGARKVGLAPVFQDPALLPDLTIRQNLRLTGADVERVRSELQAMGLVIDLNEMASDLPLPALRMIDLARALSFDPRLLILDEITAALPSDLADTVTRIVRETRDKGHSVLFISHRLAEVSALCDKATVLRDGRAVGTLVPRAGEEERMVELMLGESRDKIAAGVEAAAAEGDEELAVAAAVETEAEPGKTVLRGSRAQDRRSLRPHGGHRGPRRGDRRRRRARGPGPGRDVRDPGRPAPRARWRDRRQRPHASSRAIPTTRSAPGWSSSRPTG